MEQQPIRAFPTFPSFDLAIYFPVLPAPSPQAVLNDFLRKELSLLGITFVDACEDMSKFKIPLKKPPYWGPAKKIQKSALSLWINGHDPWPRYRLAGLICLIELRFFQLMGQRRTPKTMTSGEQLLALAREHHDRIMKESDLQPLLLAYRASIFQRLQKDRKKSPDHAQLFAEYARAMPVEVKDFVAQARGQ